MSTYDLIENKGIEKEKYNVVLNAYQNWVSVELIANITNLSIEKMLSILNLK